MEVMQKRHDIRDIEDIKVMVRAFYKRVYADDVLRPVFEDVAKVDLDSHLPVMDRFWNRILFQDSEYEGNPFVVHKRLHDKLPLNECHFLRWLSLFRMTVDELFQGPVATRAKRDAESIANSFQIRLAPNSIDPYFKEIVHD